MINTEEDFNTIIRALLISISLLCVVGFFQIIGKDLLEFKEIQKLIIPSEYWEEYLGNIKNHLSTNAVALTLFNSNYVSVYITMIIPFLTVLMLPIKNKNQRGLYAALIGAMLIILFKTYSRTGLVSLLISFLFLGYFYKNQLKHIWKQCIIVFVIGISLFIVLDSQSNYRFITKIASTLGSFNRSENTNSLEEIKTQEDKVYFRYRGEELYVAFSNTSEANSLSFFNANGEDISNQYNAESKTLEIEPFEDLQFSQEIIENQPYITAGINEITWNFYYDSEHGYLYWNDFGKYDRLIDIEKFGFKNHENIASGRGFIWSRSIPLLKDYLLIGSGPDTFPLVFPQSDYVGKANNCKTPYTLIEKPHSIYLMIGIQTGVVSLIAFLLFCFYYFLRSFRLYTNRNLNGNMERIGLGCLLATISYMVSGFFNDSSLQTSPIFWVLIGIGMAANHKIEAKAN
jgi:hypothetical protein